jgi:hypothetical protein
VHVALDIGVRILRVETGVDRFQLGQLARSAISSRLSRSE